MIISFSRYVYKLNLIEIPLTNKKHPRFREIPKPGNPGCRQDLLLVEIYNV